jgi:hypothetical protein
LLFLLEHSIEPTTTLAVTMSDTIEAEAALENCRALINRIDADLSAEEPFVNVSSAAELLLYLEFAASALEETKITPTYH